MAKKTSKTAKSNELDGKEFFAAIALIEKEEKGIKKGYMMEKITQALVSAYKRDHEGITDNVFVEANEITETVRMFVKKEIVEEVTNPRARVIDLLLPIIVLVVMIIMGYSLPRSAIYCTIFSIIIAAISPETRMGPRKLLQTLMDGVRQAANIAIPTAACGIMIGIVVNSGVAVKIAKLIGTSGEGSLFIALLIAALGCLLLGMALPTVAAYLIAVTLFASAIQGLGISALVTNMFIFYFGVVAQITPPVCLASFTAAGIAGASAWKTGWKAFSFAITAFIVPFAFVYRPAILLEGTMVEKIGRASCRERV